jgi:hypothetical protein
MPRQRCTRNVTSAGPANGAAEGEGLKGILANR